MTLTSRINNPAALSVRNAPGRTDRERSTNHLRARYAELRTHFPAFGRNVTEAQYVRVNLPYAVRNLRSARKEGRA